MNNYIVTTNEYKLNTTAYEITEPEDFFKSINMWFIEDDSETTMNVIVDDEGQIILVDTKYQSDEKIALGVNKVALLFNDEKEIRRILDLYTDEPERIKIVFPRTVH